MATRGKGNGGETEKICRESCGSLYLGSLNVTKAMNSFHIITLDPEILDGTPVFKDTRAPVETLFVYLERNHTLGEFIECFLSVTCDAARSVLPR
jgi:uncharacterized protein (DUF433 family)